MAEELQHVDDGGGSHEDLRDTAIDALTELRTLILKQDPHGDNLTKAELEGLEAQTLAVITAAAEYARSARITRSFGRAATRHAARIAQRPDNPVQNG